MVKLGIIFKVFTITTILLLSGFVIYESYAQGGGGGPPKVDIFAERMGNAILVTWENPDDTDNDIVFRYTVSRDVNRAESFTPIFNSLRDIEEKIIDETNGQEMFFYLDEDIIPGNDYTYLISAGRTQGNPNPTLSDDTRPLFIDPQVELTQSQANGHLITGRTLTPITPITWFNWNPFQLVNAEDNVNSIFVTGTNPQSESYRLALEPVPQPNATGNCDQVLEFEYSRNQDKGQDFEVVASIFQNEIHTDDDTGVEISQEVSILKHQETFIHFSDTAHLKQKWLVVTPESQKISNFTDLEIQFDITGEFELNPLEHRNLSFFEVLFVVPMGNHAC